MVVFGLTGWILFGLAAIWNIRMRRNAMKAHVSLFCYLVLNLFDSDVREEQTTRLVQWLVQSKATGEEVLLQAIHGTQQVADQLFVGDGTQSSFVIAVQMLNSAKISV